MPETKEERVTAPWTDEPGKYEPCIRCKIDLNQYCYGRMMRRRIVERDNSTYVQYKIECRNCKRSTGAHRSMLLTVKEWEGLQKPGD